MARHVHNAEAVPGKFKMREAEVDGDAAQFLLRQTVGVAAGKRLHQRALAVVNMTGRGKNGVAGFHYFFGSRLNSNLAFTGMCLPFTSKCGPKK